MSEPGYTDADMRRARRVTVDAYRSRELATLLASERERYAQIAESADLPFCHVVAKLIREAT